MKTLAMFGDVAGEEIKERMLKEGSLDPDVVKMSEKNLTLRYIQPGIIRVKAPDLIDYMSEEDLKEWAEEKIEEFSKEELLEGMISNLGKGTLGERVFDEYPRVEAVEDPTNNFETIYQTSLWDEYLTYDGTSRRELKEKVEEQQNEIEKQQEEIVELKRKLNRLENSFCLSRSKTGNISIEDVKRIAEDLNKGISEKQIIEVLDILENVATKNPTDTWDIWIELAFDELEI